MSVVKEIADVKKFGFTKKTEEVFLNAPVGFLVQQALRQDPSSALTPEGALVVRSGRYTGRAADDKYLVKHPSSEASIDWDNNVKAMSNELFGQLKQIIIEHLNSSNTLYVQRGNAGAVKEYSLGATLFTASAHHALFFNHLLRRDDHQVDALGTVSIYHAPYLNLAFEQYGLRSKAVIATNIETKEVIIIGTAYAGEIKKSVFSLMNYLLPSYQVLPMHAGANKNKKGEVSVFFGLSGTGKTTLSTQEGSLLIGDDEHALYDGGVFNFEGGCYAKTYKLSAVTEPGIYQATNSFGTILENVVLKNFNTPDFDDKSIAENARSSYPLTSIKDVDLTGVGAVPKHLFFLSADAFGVLPPVSKLTNSQAMYYFLSGYTAKLAGTEVGIQEPKAAFSTCFGAPFMIRHPREYATLLGKYLERHAIQVWLINTGWTGGKYGTGKRFSLPVTRRLIDAIQKGEVKDDFAVDEVFGLRLPKQIPGVDTQLLNPQKAWNDEAAFSVEAKKLAQLFHQNFKQFGDVALEIVKGGPIFRG